MKVCLITTSFPRNNKDDAGIFIARLAEALANQGIRGNIIAPSDQNSAEEELPTGWKVIRAKYGIFTHGKLAYGSGIMPNLKAKPLLFSQIPGLLACLSFKSIRASKEVDLIHAHWVASAIPGLIASLISNKPLIVTIRGVDLKLLKLPVLGLILRLLLTQACQITTVSEHFQQQLEHYFPDKPIHLIPNGVNRTIKNKNAVVELQNKYEVNGAPYAIYAGRVIALKRLELLIDIVASLENNNLHLVICGSLDDANYVDKLWQKIKELNITKRVHFLGAVPPQEYLGLLSGASFYCSASEYEGRSNSVLEAMAQGIPCIVSNIQGHSSVIKDGDNGVLFNPLELQATVKQIDTLLREPLQHQKMGSNAIESVKELSWESCAGRYIELYRLSIMQDTVL